MLPTLVALGFESTAQDVIDTLKIDLTGKNVVVTGASSGIGIETARALAGAGATVFALGRNVDKTKGAVEAFGATVIQCDLGSLASVRKAAAELLALKVPLHILVNNAGVGFHPTRQTTADGMEVQFGTNHVGHFLLTNLLTDALKAAGEARIVNVSSMAHFRGGINWDDIMFEKEYSEGNSYGQSKSANILHAVALQARLGTAGVSCYSLHPGVIDTDLWRNDGFKARANKTVEQGAATSVFCAVASTPPGYYNDCAPAPAKGWATDMGEAERLWTETENIIQRTEAQ